MRVHSFSAESWRDNKDVLGKAFCRNKRQFLDKTLVFETDGLEDKAKTFVGEYNGKSLSESQQASYDRCLLVYIKCTDN